MTCITRSTSSPAPNAPPRCVARASAPPATPVRGQDLRYYHANHVGSNTLVTNAAGEVAQETLLTPFGEQLVVAGSGHKSCGKHTEDRNFKLQPSEPAEQGEAP